MKPKMVTISKSMILTATLLAPFIRANGVNSLTPGGQYVYDVLSMASLGILLIMYFADKYQAMDWQLYTFGIMFISILGVTALRHGDTMVHLRILVTCLGMMLAVVVYRQRPKIFISALLFDLEVLIYLNALCLVLFPGGMYLSHGDYGANNNWLMGYDNHWFIFYYAAYFLAIASILYGGSKLRSFILIAVLHVTTLYVFSGVLVVGLLLMDILYFFKLYRLRLFNFEVILAGGAMLTVVVVFFQMNEFVQYAIANILSKSDSMNARARIWRAAISRILQSPLIGNGRFFEEQAQSIYNLPAAVNAHNMWVEVLVEGGALAMGAFILGMLWIAIRNRDNTSEFYKILLVPIATAIVVMSVDSMMETRGVMLFAMISIAGNCSCYEAAVDERVLREIESGQESLWSRIRKRSLGRGLSQTGLQRN